MEKKKKRKGERKGRKGREEKRGKEGKVNWGYEICTVFLQQFLGSVPETTGSASYSQ